MFEQGLQLKHHHLLLQVDSDRPKPNPFIRIHIVPAFQDADEANLFQAMTRGGRGHGQGAKEEVTPNGEEVRPNKKGAKKHVTF